MESPQEQTNAGQKRVDEGRGADFFETDDWSCCCCSRRTGILVLGVLFFCVSMAAMVLCSVGSVSLTEPVELSVLIPTPSHPSQPRMELHPDLKDFLSVLVRAQEEQAINEGMQVLMIIQAGLAGMGAVAAALLTWGAWAKKATALLPWLMTTCAEILFLIIGAIYCLCVAMSRKLPLLEMDGFFVLVFMFLFCLPVAYCVLAVASFYRELNGDSYKRIIPQTKVTEEGAEMPKITPRPSVPPPLAPGAPSNNKTRLLSTGSDNPAFENTAL